MRLFVCNDWPLFKPGNGPFLSRALHGSTKGWELVKNGELETFKIGTATRITTASIERFVARRLAEAKQAA